MTKKGTKFLKQWGTHNTMKKERKKCIGVPVPGFVHFDLAAVRHLAVQAALVGRHLVDDRAVAALVVAVAGSVAAPLVGLIFFGSSTASHFVIWNKQLGHSLSSMSF